MRYKWPMSYQPSDAAKAAVLPCRALAAAGQSDMVWGHAEVRDPAAAARG